MAGTAAHDVDPHRALRRVIDEARPHAVKLVGGASLLCLASLLKLRIPAAMGEYVELLQTHTGVVGIDETDAARLRAMVMSMALLMCVIAVLEGCNRVLLSLAGERLIQEVRSQLFDALLRSPMEDLDARTTGELTMQLQADVGNIKDSVTSHLPELVQHVLTLAGGLYCMAMISIELTMIGLALGPLIGTLSSKVGWRVRRLDALQDGVNGEAASIATEALVAASTIKGFRQEPAFAGRHAAKVDEVCGIAIRAKIFREVWKGSVLAVASAAIAVALWRGGNAVLAGDLEASGLFSFVLYAVSVGSSASEAADSYTRLLSASIRASLAFRSLDTTRAAVREAETNGGLVPASCGVEFKNVRFRYASAPEVPVLDDVSFRLERGSTTAIVGPSGGGKSTLLRLILRLHQPSDDGITIGGQPLRQIDEDWLRRNVGMVSQSPVLFRGSVAENIALGAPELSPADRTHRVVAAAKAANAHDFIIARGGYDSSIDERGSDLSGGQQQRIAIARVLLVNPGIILLDEATSALDAESEAVVTEALQRALVGRTAVVVAHRLSTIRNSDQILVVDRGQVTERGTHAELMAETGLYWGLYQTLEARSGGLSS